MGYRIRRLLSLNMPKLLIEVVEARIERGNEVIIYQLKILDRDEENKIVIYIYDLF